MLHMTTRNCRTTCLLTGTGRDSNVNHLVLTNEDQRRDGRVVFLSKRDDLHMLICNDEPDLILLAEAIPKAQKLPMSANLLHIPGFSMYVNFSPSAHNLDSGGTYRVCIYLAHNQVHLKFPSAYQQ